VVKRVHLNGEYFILEKDGIPIVGIMGADELEDYLELQDPKIREHIRKSHAEFIAGKSRPVADFLSSTRSVQQRAW
jgi:PHD/YefM family antitoxin component YafN of YafNO toxin-antitoxin module